jgi:hypothetical protein
MDISQLYKFFIRFWIFVELAGPSEFSEVFENSDPPGESGITKNEKNTHRETLLSRFFQLFFFSGVCPTLATVRVLRPSQDLDLWESGGLTSMRALREAMYFFPSFSRLFPAASSSFASACSRSISLSR